MAKMTGGRALVRALIQQGVDTIFALPGVQMDHFFNALYDEGNAIRVIHTRHEQATAYMANGYAQSTGKIGVYAVVPGPGFLNTTAALSSAYAAGLPVLAISGQNPLSSLGQNLGMLHEIPDQMAIMSGLTKWCARIEHPTQVGGLVRQAFAEMKSGYIRPTGLEIPLDVLSKECEVDLGDLTGPPPPPPLDDDQIDAIAKLLGAAKAPAIFIGTGAIEAGEEVLALAEILQAPVISNRTARGVVDDRHYLSHTSATGNKLWRDADVVLAVGTKLQAPRMAWAKNPDRKIIVIDIEPRFLHRLGRPHLGMVADGKSALGALATAVGKYNIARPSRQTELEEMKADRMAELETQLAGQFAYMRVLRDALGEDDILVDELTQVGYPLRVAYPVYQPRTLLGTAYQGTLGAGFATALGVKIGCPDKKVLSINGDGGFMYNVQELSTAAQQNIPLVTVVFADGAYGNVRRMQQYDHGGRLIATELRNPDFVALAESFGVNAMRAEGPEELGRALKEAFDAKAPVLIESPVGEFPDPWPVLMPRG